MQRLTGKGLRNQVSMGENAVSSMKSSDVDANHAKYIKLVGEKPSKIYVTPLTKRGLQRFLKCKDCKEHPVVFITKSQIGVCERHWAWLAESNLIWSTDP